jgi:hypothetical protein
MRVSRVCVAFLLAFSTNMRAQCLLDFDPTLVNVRLPNVIRISSTLAGWGLLIGSSQHGLWAAVPAHIVFGKEFRSSPHANPKVLAFTHGSEIGLEPCVNANTPRPIVQGVDLTFVCFKRPTNLLFWNDSVANSDPRVGETVRLLATQTRRELAPAFGTIKAAKSDLFQIEGQLGIEQQSGAPVSSPRGIVGIFIGHAGSTSEVLSLEAISTRAKQADVPVELTKSTGIVDCSVTREVCPIFEEVFSDIILNPIGKGQDVRLRQKSCETVSAGHYSVESPSKDLVCLPTMLFVPSTQAGKLTPAFRCVPNISASWVSGQSSLSCTFIDSANRSATCAGNLPGLAAILRIGFDVRAGESSVSGMLHHLGFDEAVTGQLRYFNDRIELEIRSTRLGLQPATYVRKR